MKISILQFINFLGNHFEILFAINATFIGIILFAYFGAKLATLNIIGFISENYKKFLFLFLIALQIFAITLFAFVYIYFNNSKKDFFDIPHNLSDETAWIKDDLTIYLAEGTMLMSFGTKDSNLINVYAADSEIREFNFSPNGVMILITTEKNLILLNLKTNEHYVVDSLGSNVGNEELNGVIGQVAWSPKSDRFTYEISKWSKYSSQQNIYVSDLNNNKKSLNKIGKKISNLYWSNSGEGLYFINYESKDLDYNSYQFDINVNYIDLNTMNYKLVLTYPSQESRFNLDRLRMSNIDVFEQGKELSFKRQLNTAKVFSNKMLEVGIDSSDNFYFVNNKWFVQKLFKVPRIVTNLKDDKYKYYNKGELVIDNIKWLPSGKYVIFNYKTIGVIILDPINKRASRLFKRNVSIIGWF